MEGVSINSKTILNGRISCEFSAQKYYDDEYYTLEFKDTVNDYNMWHNNRIIINGIDVQLYQKKFIVSSQDYNLIVNDIMAQQDHSDLVSRAIEIFINMVSFSY